MFQDVHLDLMVYLVVLHRQPGDPDILDPEEDFDNNDPPTFHSESVDWPPVKDFEDFKHRIDTRGGYMCEMTGAEAIEPADFNFEMNWNVETALVQHLKNIDAIGDNLDIIEVLTQGRAETQSGP
jgi:hypothetical protein